MTTETTRLRIPYPSDGQDPYYPAFDAMVRSVDAISFASVSDRNTLFYGGGTVTWSPDATLLFSSPIIFVEPTYGQRQLLKVPTEPILIPPGHFLYTELSRGTTSPVDLETLVSSGLEPNINACVLAWHNPIDGTLIWRSGARQVLGADIDGVGNNGATDMAEYVLTRRDPTLPNSRLIRAGDGIASTDTGPSGNLTFSLIPTGVVAGDYTFANVRVDEYGRIIEASSSDPTVVVQRRLDVGSESTASNFTKEQGFGIVSSGSVIPTSRPLNFEDASGATSVALALSWKSAPVGAISFYRTSMLYSFKVPTDAKDVSENLLSICLGVGGVLPDGELNVEMNIGGRTVSVIKAGLGGRKRYTITSADLGLTSDDVVPGERCVVKVAYANQATAGIDYSVDYGPIDLVFLSYINA